MFACGTPGILNNGVGFYHGDHKPRFCIIPEGSHCVFWFLYENCGEGANPIMAGALGEYQSLLCVHVNASTKNIESGLFSSQHLFSLHAN